MKTTSTRLLAALKGTALAALLTGAAALPAAAQTAYGLTVDLSNSYSLATFQITAPGTFTATAAITGLAAGQDIVGIDTRPATGQLFALGYNDAAATNNAQLYSLSTTGALTPVGSVQTLALGTDGTRIGFDFNPTVDRIRVTAANGANFRLNPATGGIAATDGTLAYATTDANAGQTPGVGSSAYTNSYIGSTATTLYNLDEAASRLVTQNPPNNGTLNTVGPLGVSTNSPFQISDLDIYFNPATSQNAAYMSLSTISLATLTVTNQLYTVNLSTGATTAAGTLGAANNTFSFVDLALAISRPATLPAVTGQLAYGLAGTNLLTFDTAQPGLIRTATGLTGVDAAQTLVGLDVRPLNNALYALGYNAAAAAGVANAQIYSINANTGVASAAGPAVRLELGTGSIGFDFNPTVDRIRVVGANRNNYRLNPANGALAFTDGQVAYTSGTNVPTIGAVAYTNSFTGANTTTGTTLYNYDEVLNLLNTQATANPPQDGQLTTVGASGITANTAAPNVDLDIYSTGVGVNTAYLVATTGTSNNSNLYTVNLTTGAATPVGTTGLIGFGSTIRDIAVASAAGVSTGNRSRTELAATPLAVYPNPVLDQATVAFRLAKPTHVAVAVFDALGRQVDALPAGIRPTGDQMLRWDAGQVRAGLYFLHLTLDGQPAGVQQVMVTH
ncbi:protein of unknown function [Hymenobacter daecheongensis DSM 21074]|uniref:DUF4394 domain-containing protein n=1 Tax=Hymenobacter daecheongensis DSM 21074 TaxID=1121955 RepID=A0A1M6C630_9BACT|nr:DUF4394 domain-containing protein [Hymenobacter daecheongensis]SHI56422.1 protein of unknown function [Hymenobacter daecheongensis DSM 21074]